MDTKKMTDKPKSQGETGFGSGPYSSDKTGQTGQKGGQQGPTGADMDKTGEQASSEEDDALKKEE